MGTSSSRHAPTGGLWPSAKRRVTSFTKGTGDSVGSAVQGFVSALGGRRAVARGPLSTSVRSGRALGAFLSGIASVGLDQTLRSAGLEHLIGERPHEVLSAIVDYICGDGSLLDDAVARAAVVAVMAQIFDESDHSYEDLRDRWDTELDRDMIVALMSAFVVQSIFQRFLADLGDRMEANAISAAQAAQREREALEFIQAMVSFEFGEIDALTLEWRGAEGQMLMRENLEAALSLLEQQT